MGDLNDLPNIEAEPGDRYPTSHQTLNTGVR